MIIKILSSAKSLSYENRSCTKKLVGLFSKISIETFSYDDLSRGRSDPEMKEFSIETERKDLIPVLKQIIKINPGIRILGSPWSPPVWMKTNGKSKGGSNTSESLPNFAFRRPDGI